jgi:hypothetical protein
MQKLMMTVVIRFKGVRGRDERPFTLIGVRRGKKKVSDNVV